jgi:hypothetical protein
VIATSKDDLCEHLSRWHESAPGDCPLPELFRRLRDAHPDLTIGRFHDDLREMHDRERVYLHPWTGPLYALPEPAFALLVGHEVAYYASLRNRDSWIVDRGSFLRTSDRNRSDSISAPA